MMDTGGGPSAISYQSGHVLPAQKLAPAAPSAPKNVDLKKFYENAEPSSSKTCDPPLPNMKRKSFLEDLEDSVNIKPVKY